MDDLIATTWVSRSRRQRGPFCLDLPSVRAHFKGSISSCSWDKNQVLIQACFIMLHTHIIFSIFWNSRKQKQNVRVHLYDTSPSNAIPSFWISCSRGLWWPLGFSFSFFRGHLDAFLVPPMYMIEKICESSELSENPFAGNPTAFPTWRIIPLTKWLIHANTVTPVNKLLSPPTGSSTSYNSPFTNYLPTNYIQPIWSGCFVACAGLEVQMHVSASYRALAGVATAWWIQSASFSAFFWDHLQS